MSGPCALLPWQLCRLASAAWLKDTPQAAVGCPLFLPITLADHSASLLCRPRALLPAAAGGAEFMQQFGARLVQILCSNLCRPRALPLLQGAPSSCSGLGWGWCRSCAAS